MRLFCEKHRTYAADKVEDLNAKMSKLEALSAKLGEEIAALKAEIKELTDAQAKAEKNRKEEKTHGEGGTLVGQPLRGRVLVIDDVITAGTAVREVIRIIDEVGAGLAGVVIGLDRQERGAGELFAIQEVEQAHDVPVLSIINMGHIINYLEGADDVPPGALDAMRHYRERYGV